MKFLVDFEVQYSLVRKLCTHWMLFLLANGMALLFWIRLFEAADESWGATFEHFFASYLPVMIISLALIPVFLLDTLRLSHRFSGPILRFRNAMRAWAKGMPVEPVHFRHGDFWQTLASDFNQVVERIQHGKSGPENDHVQN